MPNAPLKREDFRGIFAALLTPLTPAETLDEGACETLVHTLLDEGQPGLYLTGGTGEEYAIDDAVRVAVYRVASRVARERGRGGKMIAHVGGVPTRRALALARAAAEAGCAAVAALPPHGGRYSHEELTGYYAALADGSPLPLFVYHIPQATGYDFPREALSRWLERPNVLGMKYTDCDLFRLERLAALHPGQVFFMGADPMLMHGLACGAIGAIGTTYNLLGKLAVKIHAAVSRSDLSAARKGQRALNVFVEELHRCGGLRAFKALAAERLGWKSAVSPAPGRTPPPESLARLREALDAALATAGELPGPRARRAAPERLHAREA